ncbi:MAG: hypothetical protein IKY45_03575 [Clostridia bacterium]|nr:hypothetical protein [Clostridia bacterium]MBR4973525.1 hypothetical protein [Clostridia bacterium]
MLNSVLEINEAAKNPQKLIEISEKRYIDEVFSAAKKIADDDRIKIVSLAGPSGSGKTTTAHILCKRLEELGEKTIVVSLDDFYLPYDKLPILENGSRDVESVNSLNIPLIKKSFLEIISTGKTMLPRYDFANKSSILEDRPADIGERGIIIVEGLHALNPLITDLVSRENIFKMYISVNCSIEDAFGEQLLSSRQLRLVRRSLRDNIFRGSSINDTLNFWNGVVEGERKYLYCFKNTADVLIKTLHPYEPCIYRDDFLKLKEQVNPDIFGYEYFLRTAAAIEKFVPLNPRIVPDNSLIREFIGDIK